MDITYKNQQCSCIVCGFSTTNKGIHSHYLYMHTTNENKEKMSRGRLIGSTSGSIKGNQIQKQQSMDRYIEKQKQCKNCNTLLPYNKRHNKFCDHKCSASFTNKGKKHTSETKNKISKTISTSPKPRKNTPRIKIQRRPFTKIYGLAVCNCCHKQFWQLSFKRKTCSPECQRKNSTYRKIIHRYEHNGEIILLESSWEVEIAQWLDVNDISWHRPKHLVWYDADNKLRRYFSDFYLDDYDVYVDPKNDYQVSISQEKLLYFKNKITLIYGTVDHIKSHLAPIVGL